MQKTCLIYLWIKTMLNPRFNYFDRVTASHLYAIYKKDFLAIIGANWNFEDDKLYIPEARADILDNMPLKFNKIESHEYPLIIWVGFVMGIVVNLLLYLLGV